jgi:ankyrin repeat protein
MISKTRMLSLVKGLQWREVSRALKDTPDLLNVKHERGRNWLHLCCLVDVSKRGPKAARDSIKLAEVLLQHGLGINDAAFTEGAWKATPLWHAIAFGKNLPLATYLLKRGSDPDHCIWAAVYNNDSAAIRLLIKNGAPIPRDKSTPLIAAVGWRSETVEELLKCGADPNEQDSKGMTALHHMLKKGVGKTQIRMLLKYGARGDIKDQNGRTAAAIMMKKRDPEFRRIGESLLRKS